MDEQKSSPSTWTPAHAPRTARRRTCAAILRMAACALPLYAGRAAGQEPPLVLEATIPLDGVSGRIDHMALDPGRGRLLVAELGNGTVEAIDLAARRVVHRIAGLKEPQGIGFAAAADAVVVASAGDGTVRFYRADDYAPAGRIDLGDDADNVRIDPHTGRVIVGYGSGGLAIIDPASHTKIGEVRLPVHPEGFQLAPDGGTAFVNLPDARQIAVVDLAAGRQIATWRLADARANFPLAIDRTGRLVASVARKPPRLLLFDAGSGALSAQLETCGDADDVFFDARRDRIYVSCGAGAVDVFERKDGRFAHRARIETDSGARTALFVPELDRLFVAARAGTLVGQARILVFRPAPR